MMIKVAAVQMLIESLRNKEIVLAEVIKHIKEASNNGSQLIVFPEAVNGYIFDDVNQAYSYAQPIPGAFTSAIQKAAREESVYVALGISERGKNKTVFNSSILISPKGNIICKYQKHFLFCQDKIYFKPGETGFVVADTDIGRIGLTICADSRIPETARCYGVQGVDILIDSTCYATWRPDGWTDVLEYFLPAKAFENKMWIISSDRVGLKGGGFVPSGHSCIISPNGTIVNVGSADKEEIVYADIEPERARNKWISNQNNIMKDRRPETYTLLSAPLSEIPAINLGSKPLVPEETHRQMICMQVRPDDDPEAQWEKILYFTRKGAQIYSDIVVLPDLVPFGPNNIAKAAHCAEKLSLYIKDLAKISNDTGALIVASLGEKDDGHLFSTTFLVDSTGICGKARKAHLWRQEKDYFSEGDGEYEVFETRVGRVGMVAGYDGFFPEVMRILTLKGADIIAWCAAWELEGHWKYQVFERASSNKIYLIASTYIGPGFTGRAGIYGPNGEYTIPSKDEEMYYKKRGNLANSRCKKYAPHTDVIRDRRPELYEVLNRANISPELCTIPDSCPGVEHFPLSHSGC